MTAHLIADDDVITTIYVARDALYNALRVTSEMYARDTLIDVAREITRLFTLDNYDATLDTFRAEVAQRRDDADDADDAMTARERRDFTAILSGAYSRVESSFVFYDHYANELALGAAS